MPVQQRDRHRKRGSLSHCAGTRASAARFAAVLRAATGRIYAALILAVWTPAAHADGNQQLLDLARPAMAVYTDQNGLPDNTIMDIAVDPIGQMWVATEGGVASYDGRVWRELELPASLNTRFVRHLLAASDGAIWIAMDTGGIHRYRNGQWTSLDIRVGSRSLEAFELYESSGEGSEPVIWAPAYGGLLRFEGAERSVIGRADGLPDDRLAAIIQDSSVADGRGFWIGSFSGVVRMVDGRIDDAPMRAPGASRARVLSMTEVPEEAGGVSLWVSYDNGEVRIYHDGVWRDAGAPKARYFELLATNQGDQREVWAASYGEGLHLHRDGGWSKYDSEWGLPSDYFRSLHEQVSPEGVHTLWLGSQGGGLVRMSRHGWQSLDRRQGLPSSQVGPIAEVREADGSLSLWFGGNRGLARLRQGRIETFGVEHGIPAGEFNHIAIEPRDAGDALWAIVGTSVVRHQDGEFTVFDERHGLSGRNNLFIICDADGHIWVATRGGGLARYANGTWTIQDRDNGPFNITQVLLTTIDARGRRVPWLNNWEGIFRHEGDAWKPVEKRLQPPVGMVLFEGSDGRGGRRLWAGARGVGAPSYLDLDDPEAGWRSIEHEVDADLPDSVINILEDNDGRVYLLSTRGVVRLTARAPDAAGSARFSVETFTTDDGLPSDRSSYSSGLVDSAGRVWVGTLNGAAFFDPARYVLDRTPKPLLVQRVTVSRKRTPVQAGAELGHQQNNLRFELALLSTFREAESRFRTQLVGFDAAPVDWTADAHREFTNLAAGQYVLRAWGRDWAGNVSGPVEFAFSIRAPWWQWWGAYAVYAGLALLAVYGVVRFRTRTLRRQKAHLEASVEARTAELRASEERALLASQAKGAFLANISHELRTPLNAILGFAQLMAREPGRSERDQQRLSTVNRSGEHLLSLINDVLSLARIESGRIDLHRASFDLIGILRQLEDMFRLQAERKGLKLRVDIGRNVPIAVFGDEVKLRQVLANLIGNAIKFTEHGGVTVRARWNDGRARIEVEDTGPGIPEADRKLVFEAFGQAGPQRRSHEGSGLGLAISHGFITAMGGALSLDSLPGVGSCFSVELELPAADPAERPTDAGRVCGVSAGQPRWRLLVVDDVEANRRLLTDLLDQTGFEVRAAVDGADGLAIWSGWAPHAVLIDVYMPGMDGIACTREIRRREALPDSSRDRTVIVAVSASAFDHDRAAILAAGADAFIAKPIVERELWDALAGSLGVRFDFVMAEAGGRPVDRDALLALPAGLRRDLLTALTEGDLQRAAALLDAAVELPDQWRQALRQHLLNFEVEPLIVALQAAVEDA